MAALADRTNHLRRRTRQWATAGLALGMLAGLGLIAQGSMLHGAIALAAAGSLWQASLLGRRARRAAARPVHHASH
ncbi:hypothetical protein GTZ97_00040 [Aquabacterium fontiphilum]|jgi:hypothetical protein|uniref:hypothetical protein n=1 Tax=Aquabacterium fontiphilum TaxID=450365 RepID=UPI00137666FB|nr:hypothetical protein [Aquabacterium fontiphilum]NBD19058.1 hypothetical protein [Aquabacterium fontiphilum]